MAIEGGLPPPEKLVRLRGKREVGGRVAEALRASNTITGLIHLYRAEVGRMTAYRARLDTTTSWAVSSSALVSTFAFGPAEASHAVFLLLMFVNYFFLQLEARRFRAYEAARYRVLLLEQGFYSNLLGDTDDQTWVAKLLDTMHHPTPTVSAWGSIAWRLRRTYVWIYAVVLLGWLVKLDIIAGSRQNFLDIVDHARIGSVPGVAVCLLVLAYYAWLLWLTMRAHRTYPLVLAEETETLMREEPD